MQLHKATRDKRQDPDALWRSVNLGHQLPAAPQGQRPEVRAGVERLCQLHVAEERAQRGRCGHGRAVGAQVNDAA